MYIYICIYRYWHLQGQRSSSGKSPPHVKKSPNNAHEVFARAAYQQLIIKLRISSIKSMKTSQKS